MIIHNDSKCPLFPSHWKNIPLRHSRIWKKIRNVSLQRNLVKNVSCWYTAGYFFCPEGMYADKARKWCSSSSKSIETAERKGADGRVKRCWWQSEGIAIAKRTVRMAVFVAWKHHGNLCFKNVHEQNEKAERKQKRWIASKVSDGLLGREEGKMFHLIQYIRCVNVI